MKVFNILSQEQIDNFNRDGFLIIKNFYDLKKEIEPIKYQIYNIIGIIIKKYNLNINQLPFNNDNFDSGYQESIKYDRKIGGEIYDAVKQIPAFIRLVGSEKNEQLFKQLRSTELVGIAGGGYGIRIDNPNEEKYRADWHQDYPSQLRSLDGIVFWSSLIPIKSENGPVEFCLSSHKDGLFKMEYTEDMEKSGAYALIIKNKENVISKYSHIAPLSNPGDLILIDYLTLHSSGHNLSMRSRWSMQMRYFNFNESSGIKIGWKGSFAVGVDVKSVHPELFSK